MKSPFFIEYANAFLTNDPLVELRKAFRDTVGERLEPMLFGKGILSLHALHDFLTEVRHDNLQTFLEARPKNALWTSWNEVVNETSSYEKFKAVFERTALDTAFAYRDGYCEKHCPHRQLRWELFLDSVLGGRPTHCHVCDAFMFVSVLLRLVDGWDFAQIEGFDELIAQAECLKRRLTTEGRKVSESFVFASVDPVKYLEFQGNSLNALTVGYYPDTERILDLRGFITACASFSLVEFLTDRNSNVDWIKCCANCKRFFVAKHRSRKLCKRVDCHRDYKNEYIKRKRSEFALYSQRVY